MNDYFKRLTFSLSAYQQLKDLGKLNPITANMLLSGNQSQVAGFIEKATMLSQMFQGGSPFDKPKGADVDGNIRFGITESKGYAGFNPDGFIHGIYFGQPGTGKTAQLINLSLQAMQMGIKVWSFVKSGDVAKIIKLPFVEDVIVDEFNGQVKKNILRCPKNYSQYGWNAFLWDSFCQAHGLFDGSKNFLINHLFNLSKEYEKFNIAPSFFELYEFVKSKKYSGFSRDARYQESVINRFQGMLKSTLREDLNCSKGQLENLVFNNVIFNIKSLTTENQIFLTNALIAWLFCYKQANQTNTQHIIFIDDGMLIFDKNMDFRPDRGTSIINHLLAEVRKTNIKIIAFCQIPSLVSKGILGTSSLLGMLSIPDATEVDYLLKIMGVHDKEQKEYARRLDKSKREMLVKLDNYPHPFISYIPHSSLMEQLDMTELSEEEKFKNNEKILSAFAKPVPRTSYKDLMSLKREATQVKPETSKTPSSESKPQDNHEYSKVKAKARDMLQDIYNRFDISSSQRANDLNLSAELSNKVYKLIEKEQLVEPIKLNLSGGRGGLAKYFALTDKGFNALGKSPTKKYAGSTGLTHVFLQRYYKKHLPSVGFKDVEIEKDFCGKRIDVFGRYQQYSIAIEICCTTFQTEHINVLKDMDKCDYIFIVCVDKKAKQKLEKMLYKKIAPSPKVNVCVVYDLFNSNYLSSVIDNQQDLFDNC